MNSEIIYRPWSNVCEELLEQKDSIYFVIDSKVRTHLPSWIQTFPKIYWVLDPEREKNLKSLELIAEAFVIYAWKVEWMAFLWLNVLGCLLVMAIAFILSLLGGPKQTSKTSPE